MAAEPTAPALPSPRRTPREGDYDQPRSKHSPSIVAISERRRAEFWKSGALVICVAAMVISYLTIKAGRSTEVIHIMDPLGNMYAGPVEPLADSAKFFNVTTIYATNVALQRSGSGYDLFELLKLYYTPRAIAKLEEDQKQREEDIHRRNLQWKPIIDSIGDPVPAGSNRIVEVHGRVIVAGAYANRSFYDESPFVLALTYIRNPDLGKAGAYPWVCNDFELRVTSTTRSAR